ncbi:hypothetical protein JL720_16456 [Aureococcus anophagefferens]|nr:hypothetical protein JL720_16456 [Aureococcus anophagefferens]
MEGPASCVAVLLNHGARHDVRCYHGRTPLLYAALNGCFDESVLLLKAGADVHAHDDHGDVPFAWAARYGRPATAKLLRHGAADDDGNAYDPFTDNSPRRSTTGNAWAIFARSSRASAPPGATASTSSGPAAALALELCAAGPRDPLAVPRGPPAPLPRAGDVGRRRARTRAARFAHSAAVAAPAAPLGGPAFWRNFSLGRDLAAWHSRTRRSYAYDHRRLFFFSARAPRRRISPRAAAGFRAAGFVRFAGAAGFRAAAGAGAGAGRASAGRDAGARGHGRDRLRDVVALLETLDELACALRVRERVLELLRAGGGDARKLEDAALGIAGELEKLGFAYALRRAYADAAPLVARAVAIKEAHRGAFDVTVAAPALQLSGIRYKQGRYGDSEDLARRALRIYEDEYGCDHAFAIPALRRLALALERRATYAEAADVAGRLLASQERQLGKWHLDVAATLELLSTLEATMGRHEAAVPRAERELALKEKVLGGDHPTTAACRLAGDAAMAAGLRKTIQRLEQSREADKHEQIYQLLKELNRWQTRPPSLGGALPSWQRGSHDATVSEAIDLTVEENAIDVDSYIIDVLLVGVLRPKPDPDGGAPRMVAVSDPAPFERSYQQAFSQPPAYGTAPYRPAPYGAAAPHGQAPYSAASYRQAPYGAAPYGQAPHGAAPYGQAPHGAAPYGQAPHGAAPYGQAPPWPPHPSRQLPYGGWQNHK